MFNPSSSSQASRSMPTLGAVFRSEANLEAERGETILGDFTGDGSFNHATIGGNRHHAGGTPLAAPDNSFIFSDSSKMKIRDPEVLQMFNRKKKKGGYTPAEIAKQYPLDKYQQLLKRDDLDPIQRQTYEAMLANNQRKLGELALQQEMIKGMPSGVPAIAEPLVANMPGLGQKLQEVFAGNAAPADTPFFEDGGIFQGQTLYFNGKPRKVKRITKGFQGNEWVHFEGGKDGEELIRSELESGLKSGEYGRFGANGLRTSLSISPGNAPARTPIQKGKRFTRGNQEYEIVEPNAGNKVRVKQVKDYDNNLGSYFNSFFGYDVMDPEEVRGLINPKATAASAAAASSDPNSEYVNQGFTFTETPAPAVKSVPASKPNQVPNKVPQRVPVAAPPTKPNPRPVARPTRTVFDEYALGGPLDPPGSQPAAFNFFNDGKIIDSFTDPTTGQTRQVRIQGNKKFLLDEKGNVLSEGAVSGGGDFSQYNPSQAAGIQQFNGNNPINLTPTQSYFGSFGKQHQRSDSGLWTSNDKFKMDLTGDFRNRHGEWIESSYPGGFAKFASDVQKPNNQAAGWFQDEYNKQYKGLTGQEYFQPHKKGAGNPYMRDGLFGQVTYSAPGLSRKTTPTPAALNPRTGFESNLSNRKLSDLFPKAPDMTPPEAKPVAQRSNGPGSDGFWLQDMIDIGGAFADLSTLRRYMPQLQQVSADMPSFTPMDPSRQIAAAASMYNTTAEQNSLTADGAVARANNLAAAGQMAGNVANVLSQYENQNAQMANQNSAQRAEIANQNRMQNAGFRQRYLQEAVTANQQFDNSKREGFDRLRQRFKNAVTNKMGTDWLMQSFPDYSLNRVTGQLEYQDTGDFDPTRGGGKAAPTSGLDYVVTTAKQLQQQYPGLTPEQAMNAALKLNGEKSDVEQNTQRAVQRNPKQYGMYPPLNPGNALLNLFSGK